MRFSTITALAFCGVAVAQLQIITDTLADVEKKTKDLDAAIQAWSGGDAATVIQGSEKLIQATTAGTQAVNNAQVLPLNDAVKIQPIVKGVQDTVEKTITDLINKKPQIKAANLGGETYKQLTQQYDGAKAIANAISQKVPPTVAQVAISLSQGILTAVQKGVDGYADIKDQVNPNPSSSSSSGAAAAGGAAAGGAAAGGAVGGSRASNSTVVTPSTPSTAASAAGAATGNSTAAGGKASSASGFKPAGLFTVVALGVACLAL